VKKMAGESKNEKRLARHARVRKSMSGTPERPRLCVFRSSKNIYAQIIDDTTGNTIAAASSLDKDIREKMAYGGNKEAAKVVGEQVARRALEKGIDTVSFDRGGFLYHGRVKELADGAREAGLKF
jgi:large subunit ribosomal protein L18